MKESYLILNQGVGLPFCRVDTHTNIFHCFTVHFNSVNLIKQLMHFYTGCFTTLGHNCRR